MTIATATSTANISRLMQMTVVFKPSLGSPSIKYDKLYQQVAFPSVYNINTSIGINQGHYIKSVLSH